MKGMESVPAVKWTSAALYGFQSGGAVPRRCLCKRRSECTFLGGGMMQTVKVTLPNGAEQNFPAKWEREKWVPEDHPDWTFIKLDHWFAIHR